MVGRCAWGMLIVIEEVLVVEESENDATRPCFRSVSSIDAISEAVNVSQPGMFFHI